MANSKGRSPLCSPQISALVATVKSARPFQFELSLIFAILAARSLGL